MWIETSKVPSHFLLLFSVWPMNFPHGVRTPPFERSTCWQSVFWNAHYLPSASVCTVADAIQVLVLSVVWPFPFVFLRFVVITCYFTLLWMLPMSFWFCYPYCSVFMGEFQGVWKTTPPQMPTFPWVLCQHRCPFFPIQTTWFSMQNPTLFSWSHLFFICLLLSLSHFNVISVRDCFTHYYNLSIEHRDFHSKHTNIHMNE